MMATITVNARHHDWLKGGCLVDDFAPVVLPSAPQPVRGGGLYSGNNIGSGV